MKVTGNLVFEPDRGADFRKTGKLKTLILDLPKLRSLAQYYTSLIEAEHGPWCNLMEPMFGTHITVVRGNGDRFHEDDCKRLIEKFGTVTVELDPTTLQRTPWSGKNPAFWFIKVVSPELQTLRNLAHVKPIFSYDPHLTVAREGVDFFMHVKPPKHPYAVALAAADLIPGIIRGRKKGEVRQGGNEALRGELLDFAARMHRDASCTGHALMALVHNHIKVPQSDWQRELLNLFKEAS